MLGRIRDRTIFVRFRREAQRVRCGAIRMSYLPDDVVPPRVAFAIGRRVGTAVVRNRIRRRVRAALWSIADELPPGWYLVSAGTDVVSISFPEIIFALRGAVGQLEADRS